MAQAQERAGAAPQGDPARPKGAQVFTRSGKPLAKVGTRRSPARERHDHGRPPEHKVRGKSPKKAQPGR